MLIEGDIEALKEVPGTLGHIGDRESQYRGYIIGLKTSTQSQWGRGGGRYGAPLKELTENPITLS